MYKNLIQWFDETLQKHADKVAVIHNDKNCTFAELKKYAERMATQILHQLPNAVKKPIAVLLPKGIDIVAADLGIIYATPFFMNLDVKTPADRLQNIIQLIHPVAIITNDEYLALAEQISTNITILDVTLMKDKIPIDEERIKEAQELSIDTDPFCIINTSGSTGTPKGVVLNHRSFFDFLNWADEKFEFSSDTRMGCMSPVVFDIYDFELCLMMKKGATMVLLDSVLGIFPAKLLGEVKEKKVNFVFWVPTIMVNIANADLLERIPLPELKEVWFAGEVFPTKQFLYWKEHLENARFTNLYGPIEITLDCITYTVEDELKENEPLPIGLPCRNTDILLLNENDELCKQGEEGEICVRGTSLAMGYYNNPEKTATAFVQNPLNHAYPELIYRTGDMAYVDERKLIMFKGRKDSLIKHMGYRIELGEIEHVVVNQLKLVKNTCAVYDKEKKEIILFLEQEEELDVKAVKQALINVFPRYMVPARYCVMKELPRNTNGKIDRLQLRDGDYNDAR